MSEVFARQQENNVACYLDDEESDDDLMEQMAIRMAVLLPDDPQQGARVLSLVRTIYDVLTENRALARH